ncbi:MAG: TonB-dependent receptor [Owenweeksia sp.]|nr:TonB-dependent receptor [Owenweeksia sp.]
MAPFFSDFLAIGNLTLVNSEVEMTELEFESRKDYEKEGQTITNMRNMAGQSPYVVNLGLSYSNIDKGWNVGAFYNVKGPTLYIVGAGLFPDIYTEPFHGVNLSVNKALGKNGQTVIDLKVSNLLNDRVERLYQSYKADPEIFDSLNPGVQISLGVSHSF